MKKILNFDTPYDFEVTKETVGKLLLRVKAIKSDGLDVNGDPILVPAEIVDLNKIAMQVELIRKGGKVTKIVGGNVADSLIGFFSQTVKYALNHKSTANGYFHYIDLQPYGVALREGDKLRVRLTVGSSAYNSVRKMDSLVEFRTMPVKEGTPVIPVLRSYPIGKDKEFIDMELGSNVIKVVALTDLSAAYDASVEAKVELGDIRANGFNKDFDETSLIVENMHMFDNNPESDIEDLVIYEGKALDNVHLKANLTKPALESAKILVVAFERI